MSRKILATCTALVAFAVFAILPAVGSAATLTDTNSEGKVVKVAVGAKIIGQGIGSTFLTGALAVECNENVFTGTVHRNDSGIVEGTIEDAWFQSNYREDTECKDSFGATATVRTNLTNSPNVGTPRHWCLKTVAGTDKWELLGNNCTGASPDLTFTIKTPTLDCGYSTANAITGTFTTVSGTTHTATRLTMTGEPVFKTDAVVGHSGFCPSEGKLKNFVFDLYTDTDATPSTGKHVFPPNTSDPIFVSTP
jgi:hypothetical protein